MARSTFLLAAVVFLHLVAAQQPPANKTEDRGLPIMKLFLSQNDQNTPTVKLLILVEEQQKSIPQTLVSHLKSVEDTNKGLKISEETIPVSRENENKSYSEVCGAIGKGVSAIIDLTWTGWGRIKTLAENNGLPYLRADTTIGGFVRAMDAYLTLRAGTDAVLIFQNEDELDQTLYYLIGNSIIRVIVFDGLNSDAAERLFQMRPTPSYFVIFASTLNMTRLFTTANQGKLVVKNYRWNLIFTDFRYDAFDSSVLGSVLVSMISMKADVCCRLIGKALGCDCPLNINIVPEYLGQMIKFVAEVFIALFKSGIKMSPTAKAVDCSGAAPTNKTGIKDLFYEKLHELIDSSVALYYDANASLLYYQNDMNIVVRNKTWGKKLADYDLKNGLRLTGDEKFEKARKFYRIGVSEAPPWSYKVKDPVTKKPKLDKDGKQMWTGYCIDLLETLAKKGNMDFDFELITPVNGSFGSRLPNGEWDGAVGDLSRGETDMIIGPLTMTSEREEVIDFVAPYFDQSGISIVIRKPVRETDLFKFMTVLKLEVWLSIVGALTVTGIMIWLLDRYSPYSARNNKTMYPYPCREFTLKESFWFALTSFTPQGGGEAPKALSGRTLVAAYWLFVVLMLATFTANLAAFLTVERMKTPVSSLEQLARQSRINYTVVANSETHQYFINMKNAEDVLYGVWKDITLNTSSNDQAKYRVWDYPIKEQYGHILQAINQTGPVINETVGFQKVIDNAKAEFAFIHDAAQIRYEVSKNCNLTEVGEMFAEQPYAIAVQQGSHLQEEISRKILDLQKDRYFETLSARYWNSSAKGECPDTDDSEGITLESLGGVFIATLIGLALAMITLAGEVFYYKRKGQNIGNKKPVVPALQPPKDSKDPKDPLKDLKNPKEPPSFKHQITIGKDFRPVTDKTMPRVSYISVFPRNQLY